MPEQNHPEVAVEAKYQLTVSIMKRGHDPVYPNGTIVEWEPPGGSVFSDLEPFGSGKHPREGAGSMQMHEGRLGLVSGHAWHVSELELHDAKINGTRYASRFPELPGLQKPDMNLYYLVAFKEGLFWARYNHLRLARPGCALEGAKEPTYV